MRYWSGFEVLSCGLGRNVWGRGEGLRRILIFALGIVFCLTASAANGQKSSKRRKKHPKQETPATENTNAPDKELYDRALGDIKHGRQEVGRLTLQTLLQKYPNDPLAPQAEQRLRDVQELLAEGDYRIGYYYYVKGSYRAAAGRLITVSNRYPLYSRSDRALWMLANIFEKSEKKDIAATYYARI